MKEVTVCPLCHSKDFLVSDYIPRNVLYDNVIKLNLNLMILECKSCTLRFLNLIPETKDELKTIYSSEYGAYNINFNIIERLFSKLMSLVIFKSSYATYFDIPILDYEMQNNSMLDIGSGSGILSHLYSSQGWKVTSLDFNDDLKRLYHDNDIVTFVTGDAFKPDFPANTFDLIVASQILEHLPDPISALRNWHSILKENGKLIIAVPNFGALNRLIFNSYWFGGISAPFHLLFFNIESFKKLIAEVGFKTLFHSTVFFPSFGKSLLLKIGMKSHNVEHSVLSNVMMVLFSPLDFVFSLLKRGDGLLFILEKEPE